MLQAEAGDLFWSRSLGMVQKSSAGAMDRCQDQTRSSHAGVGLVLLSPA